MESAGLAGVTEFSQREELTTRLRNILHEYPPGLGAFNEFLQNADDAGARHFAVVLDCAPRRLGSSDDSELLHPGLAAFEGAALYFYNSATFSEGDFDSISSIGLSGKGANAAKIGRYGLGFNVAYHFSDCPAFISRETLVMFDPHGQHLPGGMLGLRASFAAGSDSGLARGERYSRTMDGFRTVAPIFAADGAAAARSDGDSLGGGFDGTLFRLPLRTAAQAATSKIAPTTYSVDEARRLLGEFGSAAGELLLFLQHVESIAVYERSAAGGTPRRLVEVALANVSSELRAERAVVAARAKANASAAMHAALASEDGASGAGADADDGISAESTTCGAYELAVRTTSEAATDVVVWLVAAAAPDALSASPGTPSASELRFLEAAVQSVSWGAVATPLLPPVPATSAGAGAVASTALGDRVFSFLPLPMRSGLPVHAHASFALSSNRRSLWTDSESDASRPLLEAAEFERRLAILDGTRTDGSTTALSLGAGRTDDARRDAHRNAYATACEGIDLSAAKARWNHILLAFALAPLAAKLLVRLRSRTATAVELYRRWPSVAAAESPFDVVAQYALQRIVHEELPLFWAPRGVTAGGPQQSRALSGTWIAPQQAVFADASFRRFSATLSCDAFAALRNALLAAGVHVCDPPSAVRASLQRTTLRVRTTAPEHLAGALRAALTPHCSGGSCAAADCPPWWTPLAICSFVKYCLLPEHASSSFAASRELSNIDDDGGTGPKIDLDARLHRGVDALDGLPVIPLGVSADRGLGVDAAAGSGGGDDALRGTAIEGGASELGVLCSPMAGAALRHSASKIMYTVESTSFAHMLRACDFVAFPAEVVRLLRSHPAHAARRFNLRPLTPRALLTQGGLRLMLPPTWKGRSVVVLASRADEVQGSHFDISRAIAESQHTDAVVGPSTVRSGQGGHGRAPEGVRSSARKAKGRGKAKEKARRKAEKEAAKRMRGRGGGGAAHHSVGAAMEAATGFKSEGRISPDALVAAAQNLDDAGWREDALTPLLCRPAEVAATKKLLRALWDFVDSAADAHWHSRDVDLYRSCAWPLVVTGEGMVCTIAYARERRVVSAAHYSSYALELMRRFGCLTCSSRERTAAVESSRGAGVAGRAPVLPSRARFQTVRKSPPISSADDGDDEGEVASDSADALRSVGGSVGDFQAPLPPLPASPLQRLGAIALAPRAAACEAVATSFERRPLVPLTRSACQQLRALLLRWKHGQPDPSAASEMVLVDGEADSVTESVSARASTDIEGGDNSEVDGGRGEGDGEDASGHPSTGGNSSSSSSVWTQISRGRRRARSISEKVTAKITVDVAPQMVRRLPIFDTSRHEFFTPIAAFDFERELRASCSLLAQPSTAPPDAARHGCGVARGAVKIHGGFSVSVAPAASEEAEEDEAEERRHSASGLSAPSAWLALLTPSYPHAVLACSLPLERATLRSAGISHRPAPLHFVASFLAPRVHAMFDSFHAARAAAARDISACSAAADEIQRPFRAAAAALERAGDAALALRQLTLPSQALSLAMLDAVGRSGICGKRASGGAKEKALNALCVRLIKTIPLVAITEADARGGAQVGAAEDGALDGVHGGVPSADPASVVVSRRLCSAFVDPGDDVLSSMLAVLRARVDEVGDSTAGECDEEDAELLALLSLAPPRAYRASRYALAAMRHCGAMRSLRDAECFIAVARGVATVQSKELGLRLLTFLVEHQSHITKRWPAHCIVALGKVRFVPACDLRAVACLSAKSLAASCDSGASRVVDKAYNLGDARRRYEKQWQRNRRPKGKAGRRGRGGAGSASRLLEELDEEYRYDGFAGAGYHDDADHSASGSDASPYVASQRRAKAHSAAPPWSSTESGSVLSAAKKCFARDFGAEERAPNTEALRAAQRCCWVSLAGHTAGHSTGHTAGRTGVSANWNDDRTAPDVGEGARTMVAAATRLGRAKKVALCLHIDRAIAWRSAVVLPPSANQLAPSFLKRWGVSHPPAAALVMSHVARLTAESFERPLVRGAIVAAAADGVPQPSSPRTARPSAPTKVQQAATSGAELELSVSRNALEGLALLCLGGINRLLRCGRVAPAAARRALGNASFIPAALPASEGSALTIASPTHFCTDLEESLGARALAVPLVFRDLGFVNLFETLGASSASHVSAPRVKVSAADPTRDLPGRIQNSYNHRALSDLHFVVAGVGGSSERVVYAHRLVVGLASSTLCALITRGAARGGRAGATRGAAALPRAPKYGEDDLDDDDDEGDEAAGRSSGGDPSVRTLRLPPWVGWHAALLYVQYLYTGRVGGGGVSGRKCAEGEGDDGGERAPSLYPATAESAQSVCTLLRLADTYVQPHLMELCELYLSAEDIVGVYNVLDLLTHAVQCGAEQLKAVCLHKAREMHAVVTRTDAWGELSPELRALIVESQF